MKANIIKEKNIGNNIFLLDIQLIPENKVDIITIKNFENGTADDNERQTVDDFICLSLLQNKYSPISFISQQGEIFIFKAFRN